MATRIPLAWKNLTHDPRRLAVAVGGIGFAVLLMFMEAGFKNALIDSTVEIIARLDADLILVSRAQYALPAQQRFDRQRLYQARACSGVIGAYPLYLESYYAVLKKVSHKGYPIRVIAYDLDHPILPDADITRYIEKLRHPNSALIDAKSKRKYGIVTNDDTPLSDHRLELSGRQLRLNGVFSLGTDFANDGNLLMSTVNFARYFPMRSPGGDPLSSVDLGIIKLDPQALPQQRVAIQDQLRSTLSNDVLVQTKDEFLQQEKQFWNRATPVGYIFNVGMVMGFVVGIIVCYQIIYADIADHMNEFATLRAMGYRGSYFARLVIAESFYLSLLGFIPGLLASLGLYYVLAWGTGLLLRLNAERIGFVLLLTVVMCIVSGALAIRKVTAADPAELF